MASVEGKLMFEVETRVTVVRTRARISLRVGQIALRIGIRRVINRAVVHGRSASGQTSLRSGSGVSNDKVG